MQNERNLQIRFLILYIFKLSSQNGIQKEQHSLTIRKQMYQTTLQSWL